MSATFEVQVTDLSESFDELYQLYLQIFFFVVLFCFVLFCFVLFTHQWGQSNTINDGYLL